MKKRLFCLCLLCGLLISFGANAALPLVTAVDFTISPIFTDNMILQRDREIIVWGTCKEEGATLYVKLGEQSSYATAKDGYWEAVLPPQPATDVPMVLEIRGSAEATHIFLENIIIGDVFWVLGQSNIEYNATAMAEWLTVRDSLPQNARVITFGSRDIAEESDTAGFHVGMRMWKPLTAYSAAQSSAIGVCLLRNIAEKIDKNVPLGLISMGFRGQDLAMFVPPHIAKDMTAANQKSTIYEKAIRFMKRLSVHSLIWYQGEANGRTYAEYNKKFIDFIAYLRDSMGQFPVYLVELASCFPPTNGETDWQYLEFGKVRGEIGALPMQMEDVYIVSTSDLWTSRTYKNSLHPPNKMAVARRVANAILTKEYGLWDAERALSPSVSAVRYGENQNTVYITFSHVADGLSTSDNASLIRGFQAIGRDWNLIEPLTAELVSADTVRVSSDREICILEYGCLTDDVFGETMTLQSGTHLPAAAFRFILSEPDNAPFYVILWQYGYALCRNYWPYMMCGAVLAAALLAYVIFTRRRKKKERTDETCA